MGFNEAIKEFGKEITASFVCNGVTYTEDMIISMNPHYEGSLLSAVMRCLDVEVKRSAGEIGISSFLENVRFGVKGPGDADYFYKEYGTYIVKDLKVDEEQDTYILECYDKMLMSMVPFDLVTEYPITVYDLLYDICKRFGWKNGAEVTGFTNQFTRIDKSLYDESYTFRDVLTEIAQIAGCIIAFKPIWGSDENGNPVLVDTLSMSYNYDKGVTVDPSNLKTLVIGEVYGPINSLVLARSPQEDNIYRKDDASIAANGLTEIRIENNQIVEHLRGSGETDDVAPVIDYLFGILNGKQFTLYELESFGVGNVDLGDIFTIVTPDEVSHKTIMLCDNLVITQGLNETSHLEAPEATETDYKAASTTDKMLNKTMLRVDKQEQLITGLVSKTNDMANGLEKVTKKTEWMQDEESVNLKISTAINGITSVETSTGYTFDADGLKIAKSDSLIENLIDNTGMYVKRSSEVILQANQDGVEALNLTSRQYLIVGDNSRFENYNDGTGKRTACFYIGG